MKNILIMLLLSPVLAQAGDYNDCIIDKMRGISSDYAARVVANTCREITTPQMCRGDKLEMFRSKMVEQKKETNRDAIVSLEKSAALRVEECIRDAKKNNKNMFFCYGYENEMKELTEVSEGEALRECIAYCKDSSFYMRKFGECKADY